MCEVRFLYEVGVWGLLLFWWVFGVVFFFLDFFFNILAKSICFTRKSMKNISQHDLILLLEHFIDFPSHENLWHIHLYSDFLF